jgi:hypothetical protein
MTELIDRRTRLWAGAAIVFGVAVLLTLEYLEEPGMRGIDILLALVDIIPIVLVSVGVVLLIKITAQQREQTLTVVRDLEVARLQGQQWRSEARTLLNGLGDAIDEQFKRWNLTEAEREVALLLLKGLSLKEIDHPRPGPRAVWQSRRDRPRVALSLLPRRPAGADRPGGNALTRYRNRSNM